jgi:DNA-binding transcriptional regulator YdaS (Cro superfamily)
MRYEKMPLPLRRAIDAMGSQLELARALGLPKQSINNWRRIPPHHVIRIEKLTGVSRHDLRPDIYPRE